MLGASDLFLDELYLAGERVPSGIYREIGSGREVRLEKEDILPASLDGRVASYVCMRYTWKERLHSDPEARPTHQR